MKGLRLLFATAALSILIGAPVAFAAHSKQPKPTITILSPANGATIHGTSVTVVVRVTNFKLVPPVVKNPPVLPRNEGHIHYLLDGKLPPAGITASTSHTWTNLSAGQHTLIAYLSTSQHMLYPGTHEQVIHVTVVKPATPQKKPTRHVTTHKQPKPQMHRIRTGGGLGGDGTSLDVIAVVLGTLTALLGLGILGRGYLLQRARF